MSAVSEVLSRAAERRPGGRGPVRASGARRAIVAVGVLAAAIAGFWCYHRLSWTVAASSDGAANALQARDMLQGNWLLRGWLVSDVSFYTTELPEYMLVELTRRLGPDVVHVSAAITYTLLVLGAGLLARGRARGGDGLARALIAVGIMLAPQIGFGVGVLLVNPDHTGTQVPLLLGWLVLDLAPRRWYVPVFLGVLLAWVQFADRAALLTGAIPLFAAAGALAGRALSRRAVQPWRSQWYELSLAAAAAASVAAAWIAARLFAGIGAFASFPLWFTRAPVAQLPVHLSLTGWGIVELYGANPMGIGGPAPVFFAVVQVLALALAAAGVGFACWRFWGLRRDADLIDGVLTAAIAVNLAAYLLSTAPGTVFASYNAREIAAVLPLGAVLAGRRLAPRLRNFPAARPALGTFLVCGAAALGYGVAQPAAPVPPSQELAGWLAAHHLSYGLAGPEANITTLDSGGQVQLAMVIADGPNRVRPFWYQMKASWYDPRLHYADFLVTEIPGGNFDTVPPRVADRTFGPPAAVYHFLSGYTVMVWHENLLGRVEPLQNTLP